MELVKRRFRRRSKIRNGEHGQKSKGKGHMINRVHGKGSHRMKKRNKLRRSKNRLNSQGRKIIFLQRSNKEGKLRRVKNMNRKSREAETRFDGRKMVATEKD
jgi:hypothetical protein